MMVKRGVVRVEVRVSSKEIPLNTTVPDVEMRKRGCSCERKETGLVTGVERDEIVRAVLIDVGRHSEGCGVADERR